jgi:hypothetical protein
MRRKPIITGLFCGFCLLTLGCTQETTSPEGAGTVKPEEPAAPAPSVTELVPSARRDPGGRLLGHLPPCGPTPNISNVCNSIQGPRYKSLTMLVVVNPGAAVTKPVTISILFNTGQNKQRITQTYVASTGNHFLYNDPKGDGTPRSAQLVITLTEPNPAGGVYSFDLTASVMLDPLYDVTISPLIFTETKDCRVSIGVPVGSSDITFWWISPDRVSHQFKFSAEKDKPASISAFAWARSEVNASANLVLPTVDFESPEVCLPGGCYHHGVSPGNQPLVPGVSRRIDESLTSYAGTGNCPALVQYTMTYTLRFYPFL